MRLTIRVLGLTLLTIEAGGQDEAQPEGGPVVTTVSEPRIGFIPAAVEYDKPQPLSRRRGF